MSGRPKGQRDTRPRFCWTDDRCALLRALYVDQQLPTASIARRLGCDHKAVHNRIVVMGLAALRPEAEHRAVKRAASAKAILARRAKAEKAGQFTWSDARTAELRRLYLDVGLSVGQIAERMLTEVEIVKRKVQREGLTAELRALGRTVSRLHSSQRGLMGGRSGAVVVRLAAGHARGVSGWETATGRTATALDSAQMEHLRRATARSNFTRELRRRS